MNCLLLSTGAIAGIAVAEYGYLIAKYTPLTGTFQKLNARFMKTRLVDIL